MRNDCKIHKIYIKDNKIICKAIWGMNKLPVTENNERKKKEKPKELQKGRYCTRSEYNALHYPIKNIGKVKKASQERNADKG